MLRVGWLSGVGVGMCQQTQCAIRVVPRIFRSDVLEIRGGRREISHLDGGYTATIERIGMRRPPSVIALS